MCGGHELVLQLGDFLVDLELVDAGLARGDELGLDFVTTSIDAFIAA